jgi:hypothetical protein
MDKYSIEELSLHFILFYVILRPYNFRPSPNCYVNNIQAMKGVAVITTLLSYSTNVFNIFIPITLVVCTLDSIISPHNYRQKLKYIFISTHVIWIYKLCFTNWVFTQVSITPEYLKSMHIFISFLMLPFKCDLSSWLMMMSLLHVIGRNIWKKMHVTIEHIIITSHIIMYIHKLEDQVNIINYMVFGWLGFFLLRLPFTYSRQELVFLVFIFGMYILASQKITRHVLELIIIWKVSSLIMFSSIFSNFKVAIIIGKEWEVWWLSLFTIVNTVQPPFCWVLPMSSSLALSVQCKTRWRYLCVVFFMTTIIVYINFTGETNPPSLTRLNISLPLPSSPKTKAYINLKK